MNNSTMSIIALGAGAGIALQSAMSGQLGKILNNPIGASFVVYLSSLIFVLPLLFFSLSRPPDMAVLAKVPAHLWFAGGLLSAAALSSIYWLMPRMGVAKIMALVQAGQILIAMVAGHFGWFDLPLNPVTIPRALGALLMMGGVFLINF